MKSKFLAVLAASLFVFGASQGALVGACSLPAAGEIDGAEDGNRHVGDQQDAADQEVLNEMLHRAVRINLVEQASLLIDAGADVNSVLADPLSNGYTPLALAIHDWRHYGEMIRMLLRRGADPNMALHIDGFRDGITAYEIFEDSAANVRHVFYYTEEQIRDYTQIADNLRSSFELAGAR